MLMNDLDSDSNLDRIVGNGFAAANDDYRGDGKAGLTMCAGQPVQTPCSPLSARAGQADPPGVA